ncbi:MAG: hypothetical protein GX615_10470 [Lentisphaerae bacterium]|nr:hypothetical protein [Lentisphaerota bacterium]
MKRIVSSMMMVLLLAGAASAATYVWTGSVSTNFSDAANWLVDGEVPATPPANDDTTTGDTIELPEVVTANQPFLDVAIQGVKEMIVRGSGWTFETGTNRLDISRHGVGLQTTYASGRSILSGKFRFGSNDQTGPGMTIGAGGTLRLVGSVTRYAQTTGGGGIPKKGDGTLELQVTTTISPFYHQGGKIVNLGGTGLIDDSAYNKTLTLSGNAIYDLNGFQLRAGNVSGTAGTVISNGAANTITLGAKFTGSQTYGMKLTGKINLFIGNNGTLRTIDFTNPDNDFVGTVTVDAKDIAKISVDSPLGGPGALGSGLSPVILGINSYNGGGGSQAAILCAGSQTVGQDIVVGADKGLHQLGSTSTATGTAVFSGNVMVGRGAEYSSNSGLASLDILVGADSVVRFTGNITNFVSEPKYAKLNGFVRLSNYGGTAKLYGDNTYAGGTIVEKGALYALAPNAAGPGPVSVTNGTFGGTATVPGAVTIRSNGVLSAGDADATGTLTLTGGLTMDAGSRLFVELSDAAADCIVLDGGALNLADTVTVDVEAIATPEPVNRRILDWGAAASATASLEDFVMGAGADAYTLRVFDDALWVRPIGAAPTLILVR